jgi:hypothetical protein
MQPHPPGCECGEHIPLAQIAINAIQSELLKGSHPVCEVKEVGSIPPTIPLFQLVEGHLKPLPDDGSVELRGGEVFVSLVRVQVDGAPVEVHYGHHTAPDLKKAVHLSQSDELDQLLHGTWVRLIEGKPINVVGGEVFRCLVKITINDESYPVTRGRHSVEELKKIGSVPLADELEQLIGGELVPRKDDGSVEISGCETFVSHARCGQSS